MLRQLSVPHVQPESMTAIPTRALHAVIAMWDITLLEALPHALLVQLDIMTTITIQQHRATGTTANVLQARTQTLVWATAQRAWQARTTTIPIQRRHARYVVLAPMRLRV